MSRHSRVLPNERGMMLLQVAILSSVLLFMIFSGFQTIRTSMNVANTTASSAAFQDLVLGLQQNLAVTQDCRDKINSLGNVSGANLKALLLNYNQRLKIPIRTGTGASDVTLAVEEIAGTPMVLPEYQIVDVALTHFAPLGRRQFNLTGGPAELPAPNAQTWNGRYDTYLGEIAVVIKRRSEFLGSTNLTRTIPIVLFVTPTNNPALGGCSTRSMYFVALGPPPAGGVPRKSGIECYDRGGAPVQRPADGGMWTCAIPTSSLQNCDSINKTVQPGYVNPEGWTCIGKSGSGLSEVAYAY